MEKHNNNASVLAKILNDSNEVEKVFYPGLDTHPQHDLAKKQHSAQNGEHGYGGMISIALGSLDKAKRFVKGLNIFTLAESLGGVESLVCHPATMTHASMPEELRAQVGITDGLIRLSVGIEDIDDLKDDISNALKAF